MDLSTVVDIVRQHSDRQGAGWRAGDAGLAGGTWLFSEPQPTVRRLVDLTGPGWPGLVPDAGGLEIAATYTVKELDEFVPPDGSLAGSLLRTSCEATYRLWAADGFEEPSRLRISLSVIVKMCCGRGPECAIASCG